MRKELTKYFHPARKKKPFNNLKASSFLGRLSNTVSNFCKILLLSRSCNNVCNHVLNKLWR